MLQASSLPRRILSSPCCLLKRKLPHDVASQCIRQYQSRGKRSKSTADRNRQPSAAGSVAGLDSRGTVFRQTQTTEKDIERKPSLVEQLFPEESRRYEDSQVARQLECEIPRLSLEHLVDPGQANTARVRRKTEDSEPTSQYRRRLMQQMDEGGPQTSVLVLRNASKSLTIEDFRRLIPQGRHIEGWTLEQGDIVNVVAGRDLADLSHQNYYFLLFSSVLSAFTYQGHVTAIHRLVSSHMPSSLFSPLPPGPGQIVDGLDAHAAIEAYSLTSPLQPLHLRQLKPPLSPLVQSIVRNHGYAALVNRIDRMPFEVRLTLQGPQLSVFTVRRILEHSGRDRGLSWSGGDEAQMRVSKWEPHRSISPMDESAYSRYNDITALDEEQQIQADAYKEKASRRSHPPVYIVGFEDQRAMHSFVHYWHKRPLCHENVHPVNEDAGDEPPPIADVEVLW
ncbi:hypothetical protein K431DRAFT_283328 [Polychaeton citri CBS 116435]|uniref:Uncharacterized protein n=1 Tax=Polychaeton citri CBS 116435 TaxID=1314669 RepID=A0A9P4US07_9PEZI|nr:hypothetical protein K431DRAFT_283328 [Polychaeton citri CBS 116435]